MGLDFPELGPNLVLLETNLQNRNIWGSIQQWSSQLPTLAWNELESQSVGGKHKAKHRITHPWLYHTTREGRWGYASLLV